MKPTSLTIMRNIRYPIRCRAAAGRRNGGNSTADTLVRTLGTIIGLGLLAALAAGVAPRADAAGRLNLYCAYPEAALCQALANGFGRAHDVEVSVVQKPSGELLAQIVAEARRPRGDVWWGGTGDVFLQAVEEGVLERYRSERLDELHDWAVRQAKTSDYRAVGIYGAVLVVGYNRTLLEKSDLPVPKCWSDLLHPGYKHDIQMPNPKTSGTAYMTIATLVQVLGEDAAFRFLRKLHGSVNNYPRSGAAPLKAVARGETAIGIAVQHGVLHEQARGFPVGMALPCEGTGQEIGSMAIIRGARNLENAKKFYDWALSREAQELPFTVEQYPVPAHKDVRLPPNMPDLRTMKLIDYRYGRFGTGAERQRLLERWEKEVVGAR